MESREIIARAEAIAEQLATLAAESGREIRISASMEGDPGMTMLDIGTIQDGYKNRLTAFADKGEWRHVYSGSSAIFTPVDEIDLITKAGKEATA